MDNLAHALVGAALMRAVADRHVPRAASIGIVAANAPDLSELFIGLPGTRADYLVLHRGITHSLIGAVVEIAALTLLIGAGWRLARWFLGRHGRTIAVPAWQWLAAAGLALGGPLAGSLLLPALAPGFVRYFVAGFFPSDEAWPLRERQLAHMLHDAAAGGALALAAAAIALVVLRGRLRPGLAVVGLAALLAADLLRTGAGLNPMVTASFYRLSAEMTAQLPILRDGSRLFVCEPVRSRAYWAGRALHPENHEAWTFETYRETMTPNFNLLARVPTALGEDLTSLVPMAAIPGRDEDCDRIGMLAGRLRAAGVAHVVSLDPLADPALRERAVVAPSRIAPVAVHIYDVSSPGPGRLALVDAGGGAAAGRVTLVRESSDAVEIAVDAEAPAILILRDGYAPGWRAWVDDAPAAVTVAEGHYRAVAVPAGSHRARLAYQPPGLRAGLGVMALSVGVLALLMRRRRRARDSAADREAPA